MDKVKYRVGYVVADLKRIGPTNQTLNIIRYSGTIANCVVFTLFEETDDTQIDEYRTEGIKVICLHLSRKTVLFKGVRTVRKALQKENVDIVHSWGTYADIITYYACKKEKCKHIITLRNFPVEEMTTRMNYVVGRVVAALDLHILHNCKNVIACSYAIKKKMEDTYSWDHITAIQNGVDFTKFKPGDREEIRKSFGLTRDDIVFIATGSMIPRKRIPEMAEAFLNAELADNVQLWLLGEGFLLEELKGKYESSKIKFWGKQADVSYFLSAADVFISSSESEGMPNAVLEAIACKLPVLLSDIPQHTEILESIRGCGCIYKLGDVDELANKIAMMSTNDLTSYIAATEGLYDSDFTMMNMGLKYRRYYDNESNQ